MTKKLKKSLSQSHLRSTAPSSEGAIRLRVADNKCAAGSPTKKVSDFCPKPFVILIYAENYSSILP